MANCSGSDDLIYNSDGEKNKFTQKTSVEWPWKVNAKNTDKEVGIKLRCTLGRQVVRWSGR
jgi:hypothetical protein